MTRPQRFSWLTAVALLATACLMTACSKSESTDTPTPPATAPADASSSLNPTVHLALNNEQVEVGCGMCIYSMDGVDGCETALTVAGKSFLVKGVEFNAHEHGLCSSAAKAVVTGKVEDGAFVATRFEILEEG